MTITPVRAPWALRASPGPYSPGSGHRAESAVQAGGRRGIIGEQNRAQKELVLAGNRDLSLISAYSNPTDLRIIRMKRMLRAMELVLIAMVPVIGHTADQGPPTSHWNLMLDTAQYKTFYAQPSGVGTDPAEWTLWNKVEFKVPPPSELTGIASLVMQVEIDCHLHKVAILRKVEYSTTGKVVSDISVDPAKAQFIDYWVEPSTTLSLNSVLIDLAYSDDDSSCNKGE